MPAREDGGKRCPPSAHIVLPLEGRPRLHVDALDEAEERRLWDWLHSQPDLDELLLHAYRVAMDRIAA